MYATKEMKMPAHYVDMNEKELEFAGSWSWKKFFVGMAIAGVALCALGAGTFLVASALAASTAMTVGGVALTAGFGLTLAGVTGSAAISETSAE